jgi:bifunctional non-homologous end joining protein LigD
MPRQSKRVKIAGRLLELSNLDKVMYPEIGFTKGQVIDYYRRVSRYILPHIKNRPITLKRFPNGVGGKHFYEKDAPSYTPDWVKTFPIPRTSVESVINYILINDLPTLVWSANLANLEIHPFLAKVPHINVPTMIVFDLDPGDGADILKSCEVAFLVKALLDRLNLQSFVKVSGSKGIHLHVPLNTKVTYEVTQPFAKGIAQLLESEHPDLIVSEMAKARRKGKIFVDWSQNSEHKSTVAVYSLRAKRERPFVAMPMSWEELRKILKTGDASTLFFEPEAALKRLENRGDLFAPLLKLKQRLPKPFLELHAAELPKSSRKEAKALEPYREKRDFTKTPEPPPVIPGKKTQGHKRLFVIQKHAASHLHYDLRLEMNGVLKSWAVPKGPPYELNERRLAMATEDHPMEYAQFEGAIPKGEYGGGTVMVWDTGTYELMDGNYWKGKLHVFLDGKKLKGEWVLVKTEGQNGRRNAWYFIKVGASMKKFSERKQNSSALSRRSMEQIAQAPDSVWHSNREIQSAAEMKLPVDLKSLPKMDAEFVDPMLALLVQRLPTGEDWTYEMKLDGYRCMASRTGRRVKLFSRRKNLFNHRFPVTAQVLEKLEPGTILDGEIVALDEEGRPSFNLLQNYQTRPPIYFYVFDILAYRGKSLLDLSLSRRRELLEFVIPRLGEPIRMSQSFPADSAVVESAKKLGLEGIVAKKNSGAYEPGKRSGAWVKYKINQGQEFVIGGYTPGNPFDALIVGYYEGDKLIYVGKVRNGFVPKLRREVFQKLKGLEIGTCPFANLPEKRRTQWALTKEEMKNCRWLKPELVAQIEFTNWTEDDHLRHSKFVGLREDKEPREVVREARE